MRRPYKLLQPERRPTLIQGMSGKKGSIATGNSSMDTGYCRILDLVLDFHRNMDKATIRILDWMRLNV